MRCPVDRQIHPAVLLLAKPPPPDCLDVAPVQCSNDILYRRKWRKPHRVRNRIDQTRSHIEIRLSKTIVHCVNQQALGALAKARVHRNCRRSHQNIERNLLLLRECEDCVVGGAGNPD